MLFYYSEFYCISPNYISCQNFGENTLIEGKKIAQVTALGSLRSISLTMYLRVKQSIRKDQTAKLSPKDK